MENSVLPHTSESRLAKSSKLLINIYIVMNSEICSLRVSHPTLRSSGQPLWPGTFGTLTLTRSSSVHLDVNLVDLSLMEKGAPVVNPHSHEENMQIPHPGTEPKTLSVC